MIFESINDRVEELNVEELYAANDNRTPNVRKQRQGRGIDINQYKNPAIQSNEVVGSRNKVENEKADFTWADDKNKGLDAVDITIDNIIGAYGLFNRKKGPAKRKYKSFKAIHGGIVKNTWITYVKKCQQVWMDANRSSRRRTFPEIASDFLTQMMYHAKNRIPNTEEFIREPVDPRYYPDFSSEEITEYLVNLYASRGENFWGKIYSERRKEVISERDNPFDQWKKDDGSFDRETIISRLQLNAPSIEVSDGPSIDVLDDPSFEVFAPNPPSPSTSASTSGVTTTTSRMPVSNPSTSASTSGVTTTTSRMPVSNPSTSSLTSDTPLTRSRSYANTVKKIDDILTKKQMSKSAHQTENDYVNYIDKNPLPGITYEQQNKISLAEFNKLLGPDDANQVIDNIPSIQTLSQKLPETVSTQIQNNTEQEITPNKEDLEIETEIVPKPVPIQFPLLYALPEGFTSKNYEPPVNQKGVTDFYISYYNGDVKEHQSFYFLSEEDVKTAEDLIELYEERIIEKKFPNRSVSAPENMNITLVKSIFENLWFQIPKRIDAIDILTFICEYFPPQTNFISKISAILKVYSLSFEYNINLDKPEINMHSSFFVLWNGNIMITSNGSDDPTLNSIKNYVEKLIIPIPRFVICFFRINWSPSRFWINLLFFDRIRKIIYIYDPVNRQTNTYNEYPGNIIIHFEIANILSKEFNSSPEHPWRTDSILNFESPRTEITKAEKMLNIFRKQLIFSEKEHMSYIACCSAMGTIFKYIHGFSIRDTRINYISDIFEQFFEEKIIDLDPDKLFLRKLENQANSEKEKRSFKRLINDSLKPQKKIKLDHY